MRMEIPRAYFTGTVIINGKCTLKHSAGMCPSEGAQRSARLAATTVSADQGAHVETQMIDAS